LEQVKLDKDCETWE